MKPASTNNAANASEVRVRFAPSPTGLLHIGGVRTALFNFLFAKKSKGKFILRIEDTDVERSKKEHEQDIVQSLKWYGLIWDEGIEKEGPFGPYRESERAHIYKKYIKTLLEKDAAYRCFCTKEELEAIRSDQLSRGRQPRYTGRCASLDHKIIERYREQRRPFVIRFRMPSKSVVVKDMIRGSVTFDTELFGDIVIAKSETEPLYNLAAAIDDHEMRISHVIRGEEHLANTPKQIMLQEALGFSRPSYAHVPLILTHDKTKLSKRHGAISAREYRKEGYVPEAMINFLALLGWNPGTNQEFFTMDELIEAFELSRIQKSGAIFSAEKLKWFNANYIQKKSAKELTALCVPFLIEAGILSARGMEYKNVKTNEDINTLTMEKIVMVAKDRMKTLGDIVPLSALFFIEQPKYAAELLLWKKTEKKKIKENLAEMRHYIHAMSEQDMHMPFIEQKLKEKAGTLGVGETLWPLRVALSGLDASPGPHEIIDILGKEKSLQRIDYAIAKL